MVLTDVDPPPPEEEYLSLEYMDWKSGGDTNFAPIATADGELDCQGFWKPGDERPDKGGTVDDATRRSARRSCEQVESVGADFGRVRVIRLEPQGYEESLRHIHRDDNNRFNPDGEGWVVRAMDRAHRQSPTAFMVLMEQGPDGLPDQRTEVHLPMHRGARFVVDTQRLWHVVCHPGRDDALRPDQQLRERPRARPPGSEHHRRRSMTGNEHEIVIIGAGPAGLTAAYMLNKRGVPSTILEADTVVGGHQPDRDRRDGLALRHRRPSLLHQGAAGRGPVVRDPRPRRLPAAAASEPHLLPRQVLRLPDLGDERAPEPRTDRGRALRRVVPLGARPAAEGHVARSRASSRPGSGGGSTATSSRRRARRSGASRARRSRPTGARSGSRTSRCSARSGRR